MFSSIANSLTAVYHAAAPTTVVVTPQAMLASYLSKSLETFLQVDSAAVETSLLYDQRVTLRNVQLKPRRTSSPTSPHILEGSIQEISFTWTWDKQVYLSNVTLTIHGVDLNLKRTTTSSTTAGSSSEEAEVISTRSASDSASTSSPTTDATNPTTPTMTTTGESDASSTKKKKKDSWMSKYMKQIVDHLTVVISNVNISIELLMMDQKNNLELILLGSGLELSTIDSKQGSDEESSALLQQQLVIESLSAYFRKNDGDENSSTLLLLPLLDPFGYHADVQRVTGRRFVDGIMSGLLVEGRRRRRRRRPNDAACNGDNDDDYDDKRANGDGSSSHCSSSSICLHAGLEQLRGLLQLQQLLQQVEPTPSSDDTQSQQEEEQQQQPQQQVTPDEASSESSLLTLPFIEVKVILDNDVALSVQDCLVLYRTDGSECMVQASATSVGDDNDKNKNDALFRLGPWTVDLVQSSVIVESSSPNAAGSTLASQEADAVQVHLSQRQLEPFIQTIQAYSSFAATDCSSVGKEVAAVTSGYADSMPTWSLDIQGATRFRLQNDNDEWVSCGIETMSALATDDNSSVELNQVSLETWNGIQLSLPTVKLLGMSAMQCEASAMEVKVPSLESVTQLRDFCQRHLQLLETWSSSVSSSPSLTTTFQVSLPQIHVELAEPEPQKFLLEGVQVLTNGPCTVEKMVCNGFAGNGSVLEVENIVLDPSERRATWNISKAEAPTIGKLLKPIDSMSVRLDGNQLTLECAKLYANYVESSPTKETPKLVLPYNLQCLMKEIVLTPNNKTASSLPSIGCQVLEVALTAMEGGAFVVSSKCHLAKVSLPSSEMAILHQPSMELRLGDAPISQRSTRLDLCMQVPGLGQVLSSQVNVPRVNAFALNNVIQATVLNLKQSYSLTDHSGMSIGYGAIVMDKQEVTSNGVFQLDFGGRQVSLEPVDAGAGISIDLSESWFRRVLPALQQRLSLDSSPTEPTEYGDWKMRMDQCLKTRLLLSGGRWMSAFVKGLEYQLSSSTLDCAGIDVKMSGGATLHFPRFSVEHGGRSVSFHGPLDATIPSMEAIAELQSMGHEIQALTSTFIESTGEETALAASPDVLLPSFRLKIGGPGGGVVALETLKSHERRIGIAAMVLQGFVDGSFEMRASDFHVDLGGDFFSQVIVPKLTVSAFDNVLQATVSNLKHTYSLEDSVLSMFYDSFMVDKHEISSNGALQLDFSHSQVSLQGAEGAALSMELHESWLRQVLPALMQNLSSGSSNSGEWTLRMDHGLKTRLLFSSGRWINAFTKGLKYQLSVSSFDCAGINLETSSGSSLQLPQFNAGHGGQPFSFHGGAEAAIPSVEVISELQTIQRELQSIMGTLETGQEPNVHATFPAMFLPYFRVQVGGQGGGAAVAETITSQKQTIDIDTMVVHGFVDDSFEMKCAGATVIQEGDGLAFGCTIKTAVAPGMGLLESEVGALAMSLERQVLSVDCEALNLKLEQRHASSANESKPTMELPFDIEFNTRKIMLCLTSPASQAMQTIAVEDVAVVAKRALSLDKEEAYQTMPLDSLMATCKSVMVSAPSTVTSHIQDVVLHAKFTTTQGASTTPVSGKDDILFVPMMGLVSNINLNTGAIPVLAIEKFGKLGTAYPSFHLELADRKVELRLPHPLDWILDTSALSPSPVTQASSPFRLPLPVGIVAQEISVMRPSSDYQFFSCVGLDVLLQPLESSVFDSYVNVFIRGIHDIQYDVWRVPSLKARATVNTKDLETISSLTVTIPSAVLTADFASSQWADDIEARAKARALRLPKAKISALSLSLNYAGHVVSVENATLAMPAFEGNEHTNSDSMAEHYVGLVKSRIPFLLTKATVLGSNVGDTVGTAAATIAMKSTIVGGVVGVASRDAVGAAISAGKASRGATENDKYRFGDFSRGLAASASSAAKLGSQMRGDDTYMVGDFTAGTSAAACSYASENRVRLSHATGSGIGMVAGLALAGPVGLVAGSLIAGKAAGAAVAKTLGDPKKQKSQVESGSAQTLSNYAFEADPLSSFATEPCGQASPSVYPGSQQVSYHPPSQQSGLSPSLPSSSYPSSQCPDLLSNPPTAHQPPNQQLGSSQSGPTQSYSSQQYTHHQAAPPPQAFTQQDVQSRQAYSTQHQQRFSPSSYESVATPYSQPLPSSQQQQQQQQQQPSMQQPYHQQSPRQVVAPLMQRPPPPGRPQQQTQHPVAPQQQQHQQQQDGYRFGDLTRGVVARGKQARGADSQTSGYKFGDFTRGLFGGSK